MDVASLIVTVQTKGVEAAQRELDKLSGTAGKAEKSVGGLASSMKALGAVASVGAIVSLGKQAIATADSMNLLDGRLKLATSSLEEFTSQQKELFNISKASFSELKGITDLYIKLDPALKRLGASTQAVNAVTSSFAKGLQVGGASAQESASAILQFSQAMGSGVLRGEEFNAIAEASPKLMKYMADGMGVPITAMRQLAQDGKLTADTVSIALLKMSQDIDKDFKELPVTMGKAFTNIKTDLSKLSQEFDKTSGITKTLSDLMVDLSDDLYEYSGTVFTSLNDISNIVKSSATDISMLSKEVFKLLEVFDNASKEGTGLGLFKSSLLGLKVVIDTMYVGLNNSIVLMTELARTSKNFFEDEKLSKDFLTRVNSQILTLDDLEKKYIETYKTIIKTQEGFKKPTQDQIAIDLQKEIKTIESRGKALKAEDDRKKEATKQQEKAQKDAIKLAEEWQKRKIEIATNIAIAEQDELAKPFILLEAKYKEDLEHFKGNKEAQIMLTDEYNAELARLYEDLTTKFNEEEEKKAEKAAEWQVKLLEANEKYNDEIIKMQDEMYGTDSSVEQWYDSQLEYLSKLSQESGATSEELQTLLDKIETIKAMKLEKQTISFKVEQSFYKSFEDNLATSIEDAFNGELNFKKFFKNIGNDLLKTVSSSLSNSLTNTIKNSLMGGGGFSFSNILRGLGVSAIGSSVSAGEISDIVASGGSVGEGGRVTTAGGTILDLFADGSGYSITSIGSDISSLSNSISSLKTTIGGYASEGVFGSIGSNIMSGGAYLSGAGYGTLGAGAAEFGYGLGQAGVAGGWANASSVGGMSQIGYGAGVAGYAATGYVVGGAVGGALDKAFGANTYAPQTGAIAGAALGGYAAIAGGLSAIPVVGWIAAAALLIAGGAKGKDILKDTYLDTPFAMSNDPTKYDYDNTDGTQAVVPIDWLRFRDQWENNSWFDHDSWDEFRSADEETKKAVKNMFMQYDFLFDQLDENKSILLEKGYYSWDALGNTLAKDFLAQYAGLAKTVEETITQSFKMIDMELIYDPEQITRDVENSELTKIYDKWVAYAQEAEQTVTEALMSVFGDMAEKQHDYSMWLASFNGDNVESMRLQAEYAQEAFEQAELLAGAGEITTENYLALMNSAVKASPTPETISLWNSIGGALMNASDAQASYINALQSSSNSLLSSIISIRETLQLDSASWTKNMLYKDAEFEAVKLGGSAADVAADIARLRNNDINWNAITPEMSTYLNKLNSFLKYENQQTSSSSVFSNLTSYTPTSYTPTESTTSQTQQLFTTLEKIGSVLGRNDTLEQQLTNAKTAFDLLFDVAVPQNLTEWANLGVTLNNNASITEDQIAVWEYLGDTLASVEDEATATAKELAESLIARQINIGSTLVSFTDSLDGIDYQNKFNEASESFKDLTGFVVTNRQELEKAGEALKTSSSLTDEQVTSFGNLSSALIDLTKNTQDVENALIEENEAIRQSTLSILGQQLTDWTSALGSIQNALDNLNPTFMTFAELANQTISLDNYSTLLSQLEISRQNEIEKLTQSSNLRIEQLEKEKTLFTSISDFVDELTQKIIGYSVTTSSYFFSELANAKSLITTGGTPDISALKNSATSYLDKALGESTSKIEYLREVAKVREDIGGLGSLVTGGSLEGIENAINEEQKALENQLTQLNETATNILNKWGGQASAGVSSATDRLNSINNDIVSKAYSEVLGRTADAGGYEYWTSQVASGALAAADLKNAIAQSALQFDVSKNTSGVSNEILSKSIANAQQWVNGSHANGLDYVPFDGYVAELHKGERVQTASEVQKDSIIQELQNSLKDLKDMFIKNIAETSRMSRVITRLDDNDALLVRVVV